MCIRDGYRGILRTWLRPVRGTVLYLVAMSATGFAQSEPRLPASPATAQNVEAAAAQGESEPVRGPDDVEQPVESKPAAEISEFLKQVQSLEAKLIELRKQDAKRAKMLERNLLGILKQYQQLADGRGESNGSSTPQQASPSPGMPRFAEAKSELARLRTVGGDALAELLARRLQEIERSLETHAYDFATSEAPEVHMVTLQTGSTLPEQYRTKENRFRLGYAEVHLKYRARPIILVLKAQESILWNVVADPGVRVHAVVVESQQPQELMGLDHPLVLDTKSAMQMGDFNQYNRYGGAPSYGVALAGDDPVTSHTDASYSGQPIVIGAESAHWLRTFMIPAVEALIAESRAEWRRRKFQTVKDLRFTANYVSIPPTQDYGTAPNSCVGEFSVVGPIAETLVPLRHPSLRQSIVVPSETEHLEFGLDVSGQLVSLPSKEFPDRLTPVPPSSTVMKGGNRFRAFTYDPPRHRLVLSTSYGQNSDILIFDVERAEWSRLATLPLSAFAMTYVPEDDTIWMLVSQKKNGPTEAAELWKMSHDGTVMSKQRINEPLGEEIGGANRYAYYGSMWDNAFAQLIATNGYAILVGLRQVRNPSLRSAPRPEIFVLEATSGDVVYAGELQITQGEHLEQQVGSNVTPPKQTVGMLAELNVKLAKATKAVQALTEQHDQRGVQLQRRLRAVRKTVMGDFEPRDEPRLYLIGRYRATAGPVKVKVTDTTGPVVLALSGYQAIDWQVEVADGVELTRIVAAGNAPQQVSKQPEGVEVSLFSGQEGFFVYDHRNAAARDETARRLRELTGGMEIAAWSVSHQTTDQEIRVGPGDGSLRAQICVSELDGLIADATADRTSRVLAELEAKRFFAVHQGVLPRQPASPNNDNRYWCKFTIRGPIIGTGNLLEPNFQHWAYDPGRGRLFVATQNQLTMIDTKTDAKETLNLLEKNQRLGQIMGLGYDSKRERLIVSSYDRVYTLDPEAKQLRPLSAKNSHQELGMTFAPRQNVFYTALGDRSRPAEISHVLRYNTNGAMLEPLLLSKPFSRGQSYSSLNMLQIIDLDEYVALVDYQSDQRFVVVNGRQVRRPPTGRIAIAELATGDIVYEGELQPSVERRELSVEQLTSIWHKLDSADEKQRDQLLWDMAAGQEGTVQFIRTKIQPVAATLDEVDIALLVKDLDDDRFSVRDAAFKKLQAAGSSIESKLQTHVEGDVSTEVRERLQSLISSWKSGEPQNDEERRRVRALEVLARMGTPQARQLLVDFSDPQFDAVTRRYARKLLAGETEQENPNPALQFQRNLFVPRQR